MMESKNGPLNEGRNSGEPSIADLLKTIEKVIKTQAPTTVEPMRISEEPRREYTPLDKHTMRGRGVADRNLPYNLGAPLNPQEIRIPPLVLENPIPSRVTELEDPHLLSRDAFVSVTQTFSELSRTITQKAYASTSAGSGTLDARVMVLLRGLVKEWIDQHMPALVEELVKKEINHVRKSIL